MHESNIEISQEHIAPTGEGSPRQELTVARAIDEEDIVLLTQPEADAPIERSPRLAEFKLRDHSIYRGQVNDEGQPSGHGVVYTALGTHLYAGLFAPFSDRVERQLGVQLLPNGTLFAGDFQLDAAHGDGVKRDPFGQQFLGQWHDGELDGLGVSVSVEGEASWGAFRLNEQADRDGGTSAWTPATQQSVLRALLAERHAVQAQERARAFELRVVMQGLTIVGDEVVASTEAMNQLTHEEDEKLKVFVTETKRQLSDVEQTADRYKYQEAQLKERQKNLRREITETRTALAYVTSYVDLAETRRTQVTEATRTLQSLEQQIQSLKDQRSARTNVSELSRRPG